ncbi:uncharacterized protein LACBIDRAFT_297898 [Laccaria bicolor S238N-H82]|uniref:Predicted protein n=1 Tax=Laccaria bicolor (strain S238N-H82 / ATCC MYA-4686) TaxID=486041 RepID=B0DB58_LACBS|nr:uncharacterized protein LACBIDRAFT_297898 [Laccaria bicolor S238N-H82]EDR08332.1 predicted protein [Laccaria bicolor S238N-H82]|eukprot:XP_001881402.1 predicted protein [Laccaria bicolor S238N-H82]
MHQRSAVTLFPVRQAKGHTPAPSDHSSRPSFEEPRAFFGAAVEPAPRDHRTAKRSALIRDNYCCLITDVADIKQYGEMTMAERQTFGLVGRDLRNTNFCHIFPPSTNWNLRPAEHGHAKTLYSESVSTLIGHYGDIDGLAELDGPQGHRLSNGLTLSVDSHALFDDLSLWFEEIPGQPNTYTVKTLFPTSLNRVVTFGTTTDLELPDPRYLRLHATICRVAHMSGAARYVDLLIEEMETTNVLANDGSSGDLLRDQLQNLQLRQRQPGA